METPEIKTPPAGEVSQLQEKFEALHHLLVSVLILVLVVSGTLSIYLLRQWRLTSKDLAAYQPDAVRFIDDFKKERAPRMEAFLEKLKEYGQANPNFVPILTKYGLSSNSPGSVPPANPSRPTSTPPKK